MGTRIVPLTPESQVNTSDGGAVQSDPQVVALPDGGYVVVWRDESLVHNPNGATIVGQRYDRAGERVGGEVHLGSATSGSQSAPAVTALADGTFAVAFVDLTGGDNDIQVNIFDASLGFVRSDTIDASANQTTNPALAAFADGSYAIAYTLGAGADTDIVARIVSAAGAVGAEFDIHNEADNSDLVELATLTSGNVVAVYQDESSGSATDTDILFRIFTPAGAAVTASTPVAALSDADIESDPDVAALRGGGFVVVCSEDVAGFELHGSLYDNDGNSVNTSIVNGFQSDTPMETNVVALADGGFLTTWANGQVPFPPGASDIVGSARYNAAGIDATTGMPNSGAEIEIHNGEVDGLETAILQEGHVVYVFGLPAAGDVDVVTTIWNPRGTVDDFGSPWQNDILWQHLDGTVSTVAHELAMVAHTWRLSATGDFDGDGDGDILWRHDEGLTLTWEMQDGTRLANHDLGVVPTTWRIAGTGDFDGDGDSDILWRHAEGAGTVWEMQDGQYVVNHNLPAAAVTWQTAGAGDFDGDGDGDILWRHSDGGVVTWEMENGTYVVNHNLDVAPTAWQIAGTGDFDADGDSDIVWRHSDGSVRTWEMEDGAHVADHDLPGAPTSWAIEGTEDIDSDGDAEIVWRHDDGTVAVWEMQGGALFETHSFAVGRDWQIRATGEFDLA
jgi:hypothetical protein